MFKQYTYQYFQFRNLNSIVFFLMYLPIVFIYYCLPKRYLFFMEINIRQTT